MLSQIFQLMKVSSLSSKRWIEGSVHKGWDGGPYAPKILALPGRGGEGALPLARIFWRICPQCTEGPPKVIIHHQKVIISPQKCALIPQNRSFNHISLTFSLTKMIYALLSKNVTSRIYALLLAKFAKVPGLGGQPNFGNARILGAYGPATRPLMKSFLRPSLGFLEGSLVKSGCVAVIPRSSADILPPLGTPGPCFQIETLSHGDHHDNDIRDFPHRRIRAKTNKDFNYKQRKNANAWSTVLVYFTQFDFCVNTKHSSFPD